MKEALITHCRNVIADKIQSIQAEITALKDSMGTDTKSSAGDKYETGREMMNQESGKLQSQLSVFHQQLDTLNKINPTVKYKTIGLGAFVKTTQANYFLSISYGKIVFDGMELYMISGITPIAQLMLNKTVGNHFNWHGKKIIIEEIE